MVSLCFPSCELLELSRVFGDSLFFVFCFLDSSLIHYILLSYRKQQASQGYQWNMAQQVTIRLDTNPLIKAGQATQ